MSQDFDLWYSTYPRHIAKISARTAYDRTIKKGLATAEQLLKGAIAYAATVAGSDPKFTKHPTTWLNGGCWDDEYDFTPLEAKPVVVVPEGAPTDQELRKKYEQHTDGSSNIVELRPASAQIHGDLGAKEVPGDHPGNTGFRGLGEILPRLPRR